MNFIASILLALNLFIIGHKSKNISTIIENYKRINDNDLSIQINQKPRVDDT